MEIKTHVLSVSYRLDKNQYVRPLKKARALIVWISNASITMTNLCNIQPFFAYGKNDNFQNLYLPSFCSKHRFWVHVRTASLRLSEAVLRSTPS